MRTAFVAQLAEVEQQLEQALREVPPALAMAAAANPPAADPLAELLAAEALRLRTRCRSADATLVTIAACQAPVASDLRLLLALLQLSRHAMLIANQLRMIGGQLDEIGPAAHLSAETGRQLVQMIVLAGAQLDAAITAFCARRPDAAAQIDVQDSGLDRLNRELFADARDLEGSATRRGVAMRHMLIARSLERIGDNALGIARQAGFVVDGHRSSPASAPGP
jgi:phosphate transport system protein